MDSESISTTLARHLRLLYPGGAAPDERIGPGWWAVATGERHADLNLGGLTPSAGAEDAAALVAFFEQPGVPAAVVSAASTLPTEVTCVLADAGYQTARLPEPLMWCPQPPVERPTAFRVEPVGTAEEAALAIAVAAEGHGVDELAAVIEQRPFGGGPVRAWLAWEGDRPLSVVWLTVGSCIGVFAMMTPPQDRRRGAGRAVLSAALSRTWLPETQGAFLWSSPLGRPLYESLGFRVLDECTIWVLGGTEEMMAAVGNA
jgi:hypothetical protein